MINLYCHELMILREKQFIRTHSARKKEFIWFFIADVIIWYESRLEYRISQLVRPCLTYVASAPLRRSEGFRQVGSTTRDRGVGPTWVVPVLRKQSVRRAERTSLSAQRTTRYNSPARRGAARCSENLLTFRISEVFATQWQLACNAVIRPT